MRKLVRVGLAAAVGAHLAALAAVGDELDAVEKQIQAAWQKHKSVTARMSMVAELNMGEMVLEGRGEGTYALLRTGDKVLSRIEVHKTTLQRVGGTERGKTEQQMTTIIDGEFSYSLTTTKRGEEGKSQTDAVKNPIDPKMCGDPRQLLAQLHKEGDVKLLPADAVDGQPVFVIEAVSQGGAGTPSLGSRTDYSFQQASGFLVKLVTYDFGGQPMTTMTWTDLKFDADLNPDQFVFRPPVGVPVIDNTRKKP